MSPPVVFLLVACATLVAGDNYTLYRSEKPRCAGAIVVETKPVGVCLPVTVPYTGAERLECDAKGNLISYRYGRDVDPAKTAQRLADCEKNAPPTYDFIQFGAWEKNVCQFHQPYQKMPYYTKAEFPCPTPLTTEKLVSGKSTADSIQPEDDYGSGLPGVVNGWNTSIGNESDRLAAAKHFNFTVVDDELLWRNNSLTPFTGKVLRATKVKVVKRNLYSTFIEWYINHNKVLWTVSPGPQGIAGDIIESIDTTYIRRISTAGWASPTSWLESDHTKNFPPIPIPLPPIPGGGLTDWGVAEVVSSSETSIVVDWRSYQKGEVVVTWDLQENL